MSETIYGFKGDEYKNEKINSKTRNLLSTNSNAEKQKEKHIRSNLVTPFLFWSKITHFNNFFFI